MIELSHRPTLGHYILVRELPGVKPVVPESPGGEGEIERWVALHDLHQTSHLLYRFPRPFEKPFRRRFADVVELVQRVQHPHGLPLEHVSFDLAGRACVITPYPGDAAGVLTLADILRLRGGQLSPEEARRGLDQLLALGAAGAQHGVVHGPVNPSRVLVGKHGGLLVELFGLEYALANGTLDPVAQRAALSEQTRSIVAIGYQMVTGLTAEAPIIPATRLVRGIHAGWDRWFNAGLDPMAGYEDPADALARLAVLDLPDVKEPESPLGVWSRWRSRSAGQRQSR